MFLLHKKNFKGNIVNVTHCCNRRALAGLLSCLALMANFDLLHCATTPGPVSCLGHPCLSAAVSSFVYSCRLRVDKARMRTHAHTSCTELCEAECLVHSPVCLCAVISDGSCAAHGLETNDGSTNTHSHAHKCTFYHPHYYTETHVTRLALSRTQTR